MQGANLKEEDIISQVVHTTAHAYLLFFSNRGRVFRLKAHEIPMKDRTARGTAIVNLLPLANDEKIQAVIDTRAYDDDSYLFFATKNGTVKKTVFSEYDKSRREGFIAINLKDGDELVKVVRTSGDDDIFMVSRMGMTIRFNEDDVRPMGRSAAGVRGMKLKAGKGDEVVSCDVARDDTAILIVTDNGYGKRTQLDKFNVQGRGGQGVIGIKLTAKKGYVVGAFMVGLDDEVFMVSSAGVANRIPVRGISSQGRAATGVRLMNLDSRHHRCVGGAHHPGRRVRPAGVTPRLSTSPRTCVIRGVRCCVPNAGQVAPLIAVILVAAGFLCVVVDALRRGRGRPGRRPYRGRRGRAGGCRWRPIGGRRIGQGERRRDRAVRSRRA